MKDKDIPLLPLATVVSGFLIDAAALVELVDYAKKVNEVE